MAAEHYVIVGNGAAANKAADVLRAGDSDGRITLISDEFFPFYYRHMLRQYLVGDKEEEDLMVRPPSYYKEHRIRLRLGQTVVKADLEDRTLYLKHMEKVHYTRLLLCVGGRPRTPEVHYAYQDHFTMMKTLADARSLRQRLPEIQRVLIVGGDLTSVRVAASLLKKEKQVLFMIDGDSFWPLKLTTDRRAELTARLEESGATVIDDDAMAGVELNPEGGYDVHTHKGERIACDLIGAFFGLIPDVEFLVGSGLDIERGILVDEFLQTNIANVYAAGDCAQVYNPDIRNYWVSIGWANAERLGEVAARNMLGDTTEADQPPVNALTFEGVKVNTSWWRAL